MPTAGLPVLKSIGKGEGTLNLIAWEGYLQPQWVKPFEQQTGCQIHSTYAGSSDQMVSLMKNGGGGQYDMVSSSGDADLRIIYAGDARPVIIPVVLAARLSGAGAVTRSSAVAPAGGSAR